MLYPFLNVFLRKATGRVNGRVEKAKGSAITYIAVVVDNVTCRRRISGPTKYTIMPQGGARKQVRGTQRALGKLRATRKGCLPLNSTKFKSLDVAKAVWKEQ